MHLAFAKLNGIEGFRFKSYVEEYFYSTGNNFCCKDCEEDSCFGSGEDRFNSGDGYVNLTIVFDSVLVRRMFCGVGETTNAYLASLGDNTTDIFDFRVVDKNA